MKEIYTFLKTKTVIICGITRDDAEFFSTTQKNVESMGNLFRNYRGVFFENDSSDGTKENLKKWAQENVRIKILSENFGCKKRPTNQFLSFCRNKYLEEINKEEYLNFDYVIIIDMDMGEVNLAGFATSFSPSLLSKWDVISANGVMRNPLNREDYWYFDVFAFRNNELQWNPKNGVLYNVRPDIIAQFQKKYEINFPAFEVDSAFGGMAIYKKNLLKECFYDSPYEDCDHVYLHKTMKEKYGARIMVNPAMIIEYAKFIPHTSAFLRNTSTDISNHSLLRLNLGCGSKLLEGYINVDKFGNPDFKFDLETFPWPWKDDSVSEIRLEHVLEHLGQLTAVYLKIIQEMYRVCAPNAKIEIVVPHPRHDNFLHDPTHVRPITPFGLSMFSKRLNREWQLTKNAATPLGLYLDVDFELVRTEYVATEFWFQRYPNSTDINLLLQESAIYNNLVGEIRMTLVTIK